MAVQHTGYKSYFWCRKVRGLPVWRSLGSVDDLSLEQARDAANQLSNDRAVWKNSKYQGDSPFDTHREELTFRGAVEEYVKRRIPKAKNPADAERRFWRQIKHDIPSSWQTRKLSAISRREVSDLHTKIGATHMATANATVRLIRTIFNSSIKAELWRGENPAAKLDLYSLPPRKRFLQRDEAWQFFEALESEPNPDMADFVKLAIWTGARKSDIFGMRWQDVSIEDNRWTVPNPKSRDSYTVALTPEAVEIFTKRAKNRIAGSPWVFPSHGKTGHVIDLKGRWKELLKRAGIEDLHVHDLRRTLGSWLAAQGTSLTVIGKALGHKSQASTQIYAQLNLDPVRESVNMATRAIIAASKKKPKQLAERHGA